MKTNTNYNSRVNFGSVKLANLALNQVLANSRAIKVNAELHKLDVSDMPLMRDLFRKNQLTPHRFFDDIYFGFKDTFEKKVLKPENKIFLMVKQNAIISAICEATLNPNCLNIDYITNLNKHSGVKGAGTSMIVKLVEEAEKRNMKNVTLCAIREAIPFYNKLGFEMIDYEYDFEMKNNYFDAFLKKFKSKYFTN